jgi:hypothetical protein
VCAQKKGRPLGAARSLGRKRPTEGQRGRDAIAISQWQTRRCSAASNRLQVVSRTYVGSFSPGVRSHTIAWFKDPPPFSGLWLRGGERRHGASSGGGAAARGFAGRLRREPLRPLVGADRSKAPRTSLRVCTPERPRSCSPFPCSYRRRSSCLGGRQGPARIRKGWCSLERSKPKREQDIPSRR